MAQSHHGGAGIARLIGEENIAPGRCRTSVKAKHRDTPRREQFGQMQEQRVITRAAVRRMQRNEPEPRRAISDHEPEDARRAEITHQS